MVAKQGLHPALARFCSWTDQSSRMLLVRAAPGTGRTWFAQSWIGDRRGEVHDYSSKPFRALEELRSLSQRLSEDRELHIAVILAPNHDVWDAALVLQILIAEQRDLLLRQDEILAVLRNDRQATEDEAWAIHRHTGGWLCAVDKLVENGNAHESAMQLIRTGLAVWLGHRDPTGELAEAVFLPSFDGSSLDAFYGRYSSNAHKLDDLVRCGLIQEDEHGHWGMPLMIRRLLLERVRRKGAVRTAILEDAAMAASIGSNGIAGTAKMAVDRRNWAGLSRIIVEYWDDMFLNDPNQLVDLVSKIPPFVAAQYGYLRLGSWLLKAVTHNEAGMQIPLLVPNYASDQLAQQLRNDADRLYINPNGRGISIGLLEMLHLRLNGMYEEAAEAALRAREALHRAQLMQQIRPSLAALIHAQAGNCLYLAGNEVEALQSFELSLASARTIGNPYLQADAAGKLALFHAMDGNFALARSYLVEHEQAIGDVRWGQETVGRAGVLARGYLATSSLDWDLARTELAKLPHIPDRNELWPIHTYLLAAEKISSGFPSLASRLVRHMRRQRPIACSAPLARKLLDDIVATVALIEHAQLPQDIESCHIDPTMLAMKNLSEGKPDAALALLEEREAFSGIRSSGNLAEYLDIVARNAEGPTVAAVENIQRLHEESGSLYELGLIKLLPGWGEIDSLLLLDEDSRRKLSAVSARISPKLISRPTLTPREREVLRGLRHGKTRKQIAEESFRSEETIKSQIKSLYRKLDAKNVEQVLAHARYLGI